MVGLWADAWFYISSLGLCVSGILFFFLLGQYRAAAAAADRAETETRVPETDAGATTPVQIVYALPDPPETNAKVASVADARSPDDTLILPPKPSDRTAPAHPTPPPAPPPPAAPLPEPKTPSVEAAPPSPRSAPTAVSAPSEDVPLATASPAAAYLQGLKNQLDALQDEVRGLSRRLDAANDRDENMIARLGEIAKIVSGLNHAAGAPAAPQLTSEREKYKELSYNFDEKMQQGLSEMIDAHFGDGTPAASRAAEPVAAEPAATESATEPAETPAAAAETAAPVEGEAAPAEAAATAGEDAEAAKPRRGPVWPV